MTNNADKRPADADPARSEGLDVITRAISWMKARKLHEIDGKELIAELEGFADARREAHEKATDGKAELRDGQIVVSVDVEALPIILSGACASDALADLYKVSDAAAFAVAVVDALNEEAEDGTTRVHAMFDSAFDQAIEHGAQGVEVVDEDEFERETQRLLASALKSGAA